LPVGVRDALFQSVQELLLNVVKHARANRWRCWWAAEGRRSGPSSTTESAFPDHRTTTGYGLFSIEALIAAAGS
jgi:glucose-6-phosphate-specific signal transduction histidine kinase